jgi:hypothetical protein
VDLIDQRFGFKPAVGPDAFRKPLYSKELARAVPRFCQPIRVEEQDVFRTQRNADLVVDFSLADP